MLPREKREEVVQIVEAIGKDRVFNGQQIQVMEDDEFLELDDY